MLHSGVILPQDKLAIAIFKDFSDVVSSRRLLTNYAYQDDLTGVANRRGLQEHWRTDIASNPECKLAFLMVDLDDFKRINDEHGHDAGNEVLRVVAARLKRTVRETDLVCRLGGDEFGVLLLSPGDNDQVSVVCDRILKALTAPIGIGAMQVEVGVSVGGCFYPDQARSKRELLQRADLALYQVKKEVKGAWSWYGGILRGSTAEG